MGSYEEYEVANEEQQTLTYCDSKNCMGFPAHAVSVDEELVCPICHEALKDVGKVVILGCAHFFCKICFVELDKRYQLAIIIFIFYDQNETILIFSSHGCPMCRLAIRDEMTVSRMISCEKETLENIITEHMMCIHDEYPEIKHFIKDLNVVWLRLIAFILETQRSPQNYKDVKGIEIVCFDEHKQQGRLLNLGKGHAIIKMEEGETQAIFSCLLPSMSFRLIISPNDDSDLGQDNEYADEAVGNMNQQLEACWKVFSRLVGHDHVDRVFVRKFRNTMCYLLITGFCVAGVRPGHFTPTKAQLARLKKCNFNVSYFDDVRRTFPLLDRNKLNKLRFYKDKDFCCENQKVVKEGEEDSSGDDE